MLNAGIVGLGWWGRNIVEAVQGRSGRIRFVHGASQEPESVRELMRAKGMRLSTSLDEVIADPGVGAVVLATPHSLHAEQIVRVAEAGKPVFCEKPLALKQADADRAIAACRAAGVPLGVGQNKRFWPSMRELRRVIASGALGEILHVEGHYSNENSSKHFSAWRDLPTESPGAGMTGTGIHLLDAFANIAGRAVDVNAQFAVRRAGHDPRDTVSVLFRFANGMTGFLGAVRASPFYWRVHVFGDAGSAEALGENELVVRTRGGRIERSTYPAVDSLLAEFDAFADAAAGVAPYPVSLDEMSDTIASFEAVIRSLETGAGVRI